MAEALTLSYLALGLLTIGLLYVIWQMIRRNQNMATADNTPAIAGSDQMSGLAKDPSQFDEPDDDALDEMAEVMAVAAGVQAEDFEDE